MKKKKEFLYPTMTGKKNVTNNDDSLRDELASVENVCADLFEKNPLKVHHVTIPASISGYPKNLIDLFYRRLTSPKKSIYLKLELIRMMKRSLCELLAGMDSQCKDNNHYYSMVFFKVICSFSDRK